MQDVTRFSPDAVSGADEQPMVESEEKFVPKGAMAFFFVMLLVFTLMWFSIYFEMVGRV